METPLSPFTPEPKTHIAEELFLKYRHLIFALLFISLSVGIYLMLVPPKISLAQDSEAIRIEESTEPDVQPADSSQIVVDIAGAVQNPGVYFLNSGSIVEDAVLAAGGFSLSADSDAIAKTINRAERIEAHSKIYIPRRGDNLNSVVTTSLSTNTNKNNSSQVNINTATIAELDILPGIGPVTAQRIIDYRLENGDFETIEGIKNVPGISDGKFDQLKNLITV